LRRRRQSIQVFTFGDQRPDELVAECEQLERCERRADAHAAQAVKQRPRECERRQRLEGERRRIDRRCILGQRVLHLSLSRGDLACHPRQIRERLRHLRRVLFHFIHCRAVAGGELPGEDAFGAAGVEAAHADHA
jgi:hypothetical protein